MVIFGGFERGVRKNTIMQYSFKNNTWELVEAVGQMPQARAGHSAVIYSDAMYVFGGKDEDNEKLNDLWCFNFETKRWSLQNTNMEETAIASRSGHSASVFNDYMIIFAGIHEVTKELDDMAAYSFKSN